MLKRDLSHGLFSRELQALDELFSREPEDRTKWAGYGYSTAKREPSPQGTSLSKSKPKIDKSTISAPFPSPPFPSRPPSPVLHQPTPVNKPNVVKFIDKFN